MHEVALCRHPCFRCPENTFCRMTVQKLTPQKRGRHEQVLASMCTSKSLNMQATSGWWLGLGIPGEAWTRLAFRCSCLPLVLHIVHHRSSRSSQVEAVRLPQLRHPSLVRRRSPTVVNEHGSLVHIFLQHVSEPASCCGCKFCATSLVFVVEVFACFVPTYTTCPVRDPKHVDARSVV